jgi:CheY-like chemotaxis protein
VEAGFPPRGKVEAGFPPDHALESITFHDFGRFDQGRRGLVEIEEGVMFADEEGVMFADKEDLRGLNVLVVEDAFLVAIDTCAQLEAFGCRITGPVARLEPALALARGEPIDGALLDINLAGEMSFPVAAVLEARNLPYVFLTGYDTDDMFPPEFRKIPRLPKPVRNRDLIEMLVENVKKAKRRQRAAAADAEVR